MEDNLYDPASPLDRIRSRILGKGNKTLGLPRFCIAR
jgi:hypothetical protein